MSSFRSLTIAPWVQIAVFVTATIALSGAAALLMFSAFMFYDDEGYVLISLRNFAEHGNLYGGVYTQYGPFPFVFYSGLHALGLPLTHTAGRLVTLAAWGGSAMLCAWLTGRVTQSLPLRLAVLATVFVYFWVMASEPTHPGGLIAIMTAVLATVGYLLISRGRGEAWAVLIGAGTAALALTKINVGAFAAFSAIAWFLLHHRAGPVRRIAPWLVTAGAIVLPFGLMRSLLGVDWVQTYAFVFACSAATAMLTVSLASTPVVDWKLWRWGIGGASVVALIVLGVVFLRGTTGAELLDGILIRPLRQPTSFSLNYRWAEGVRFVALGSLLLWGMAWWLRRWAPLKSDRIVASLRLGVALALVVTVLRFPNISPDNLVFSFLMPSLWLFLWPLEGEQPTAAPRSWIGLLLLGQCLHVFPVAGSQIAWGTFLSLPLGAIGAWQAAGWLARQRSDFDERKKRWLVATAQGAVLAFAIVTAAKFARVGARYRDGSDLSLPGAEVLRLPSESTALFRLLTLNSAAHGDMLFSMPGMFSLNLWTGLPTPSLANVTHWFSLLKTEQQQEIIRSLEAHPRACVIVQREHVNFLTRKGFQPAGILHDYIAENFVPAFTLDDFEFCVRRNRQVANFMIADTLALAPSSPETTVLRLPLFLPADRAVAQVELAAPSDPSRGALILNQSNSRVEVTPINLRGEPVGPTEARAWPFTLNGPATVLIYYNRADQPRPTRGALIVLRESDGAEVALGRLRQ